MQWTQLLVLTMVAYGCPDRSYSCWQHPDSSYTDHYAFAQL